MKRKTMAECWRLLMGVILACMALQGTHFCAGQTATPAKAASVEAAAGAASILGTYYFKGIGLLEIRQEGDLLVTELYGETESRAAIAAAVAAEIAGGTPQKPAAAFLSPQPHRGRLVGATRIEFADADSSPEAQRL